MQQVRVIEVKENIFAKNDIIAGEIREQMRKQRTFFLNVMSGPGSGKTTLLTATINALKAEYRIGVMDMDIDSSVDAQTVADATGVEALQLHNGGLCHTDADMVRQALEEYDTAGLDLLILENIGNLVCPAEFDTGAHKNAAILSVPEGDDKPLKYPLMFEIADVLLINKIDVLPVFDFDLERLRKNVRARNPRVEILPISAKTGEGMSVWLDWLCRAIAAEKRKKK